MIQVSSSFQQNEMLRKELTKRESDVGRVETMSELSDFGSDGVERLIRMLFLGCTKTDDSQRTLRKRQGKSLPRARIASQVAVTRKGSR